MIFILGHVFVVFLVGFVVVWCSPQALNICGCTLLTVDVLSSGNKWGVSVTSAINSDLDLNTVLYYLHPDGIKMEIPFLLDIAQQKNRTPLPLIKPYSGPLTAPSYGLKSLQKRVSSTAGRITVHRLSVGTMSSRPSTPTLGTPSVQAVSVSAKVGAPVSLAGQRLTFQIPSSQPTGKSATPTVQNVLINPSLIGPKNILITTNTVPPSAADPNPCNLKRKHEDDDDYDAL
ncbi:LOW QUALITY PROTEIN: transcription initiation factor TFIID subunit 9-like [Ammospiza maritima maritima]